MNGHLVNDFPDPGSVGYSNQPTNLDKTVIVELSELVGRYPHPRSALLLILHLVQPYDSRINPRDIELCAEILGITTTRVSRVTTFYAMFKRRLVGHHHPRACTTALCAIAGGNVFLERAKQRLGIDEGQTTPCGRVSLERLGCSVAYDYAPVTMVNWGFSDGMTPERLGELIDILMNSDEVVSPCGATIASWKKAERVLVGFPDGRTDEGSSTGHISTLDKWIVAERGQSAPDPDNLPAVPKEETK